MSMRRTCLFQRRTAEGLCTMATACGTRWRKTLASSRLRLAMAGAFRGPRETWITVMSPPPGALPRPKRGGDAATPDAAWGECGDREETAPGDPGQVSAAVRDRGATEHCRVMDVRRWRLGPHIHRPPRAGHIVSARGPIGPARRGWADCLGGKTIGKRRPGRRVPRAGSPGRRSAAGGVGPGAPGLGLPVRVHHRHHPGVSRN